MPNWLMSQYFEASSNFDFSQSMSSRSPVLVVMKPGRTRWLPFGSSDSGSSPPARSVSYSMKKMSTPVEKIASAAMS